MLKTAKVIPIFKSGSKLDMNNYRPISFLATTFEKLMHLRLYKFLENNKVIYQSQFGFQRNKSTTHQFIHVLKINIMVVEFSLISKKHLTQSIMIFYYRNLSNTEYEIPVSLGSSLT